MGGGRMTDELKAARAAGAKALQLLVYEAAQSGKPFIGRDTAEALIDAIATVVLETIAANHAAQQEMPDVHSNVARANQPD